jgi:hypothetical protein
MSGPQSGLAGPDGTSLVGLRARALFRADSESGGALAVV